MNDDLIPLVRSWFKRRAVPSASSDSDTLNAAKVDLLIDTARCKLDDSFFEDLARAIRAVKKFWKSQHVYEILALYQAYFKLKRNGETRPTFHQVQKLATSEFGLGRLSKSTLKRIRRNLGFSLPHPRGKAKKGGPAK